MKLLIRFRITRYICGTTCAYGFTSGFFICYFSLCFLQTAQDGNLIPSCILETKLRLNMRDCPKGFMIELSNYMANCYSSIIKVLVRIGFHHSMCLLGLQIKTIIIMLPIANHSLICNQVFFTCGL